MNRRISKNKYLWEVGGLNAILYKIRDRFFGGGTCEDFMQRVYEATSPEDYAGILEKRFRLLTGKDLSLENPRTFNEKIQWIKLNGVTPLMTRLADKYLVREWVADKIGEKALIPLLGVWDSFDEIDFEQLPEKFVLKCNHGSGMNLAVKDRQSLNREEAREKFGRWMATDYAVMRGYFELQYREIPRKIIAEEYIEQLDGGLADYKIHVFGGVPKIIQVIGGRDPVTHTAKEAFLDPDWNRILIRRHTYGDYEETPPKPENLGEMLETAKKLGADFSYVRVDLYDISGGVKFGEMTFTPASGFEPWEDEIQERFGSWIRTGSPGESGNPENETEKERGPQHAGPGIKEEWTAS